MAQVVVDAFVFVVKMSILYVVIWDAVKNGIISARKYMDSKQGNS